MKKQSRTRERVLAVKFAVDALADDLNEEEKFIALEAALNATAVHQEKIGYADLGHAIGVFSGSPAFSVLLDRKVREDAPGPLFCSLVVGANGKPSAGFITAALGAGMQVADPDQFITQQQNDCYAVFTRRKKP